MPASRPFLFPDSQAGVFHVVSRIYDKRYLLGDEEREFFMKTVRAYEDLLGVEVLTFCVMSNHFHLLVRVPHRPVDLDVPLEVVLARLERAIGEDAMKLIRQNMAFWESTGNVEAIEEWRQKQVARMYSLSEFVKCVKFRFTRWYNRKTGRKGGLWESRFTSVIVQEEERALRTMAAYIDLNPVRAGMVADPADYRWSGYAEAMAGKARARRGVVRIIGKMAWGRAEVSEGIDNNGSGFTVQEGSGGTGTDSGANVGAVVLSGAGTYEEPNPWGTEAFPAGVERRALVFYRALLGGQGAERKRADGTVVRRGLSEKTRERLTSPKDRQVSTEILTRRVRHFTRGVMLGSRAFIDGWFAENRQVVQGRSRTERSQGAKSLGRPALRGLYAFRNPGRS